MKAIGFLLLFTVLAFCGLTDRLKQAAGGGNTTSTNTSSNSNASGAITAEPAKPSSSQEALIAAGTETAWPDQGLSWRLSHDWSKMDITKDQFDYQGPDGTFLLVSVSTLPDSFPMETSLKAYHEQALQQLKIGKYESVKLVSIDGLPGVEFVEAPPPGKDDVRRHQWIGYRRYLGTVQQVNAMTTTKQSKFDKHTDDFAAIMYSMKATK